MEKIPVYFMPGLAASPAIFERILFPENFEIILLEWQMPFEDESLGSYAERMAHLITRPKPVLIGVSFGGILVQEMAKFLDLRKLIIISSIKSQQELPPIMKLARRTGIYKWLPTDYFVDLDFLAKFTFVKRIKERLPLYQKYLSVRDKQYLDWAIAQVVLWDREEADLDLVHIQGDQDEIFPIKYIKNCIVVQGGTHIMILNRFRWFNEHLPKLILE